MTLNPDVVRTRCAEIEDSVQRLEALARLPLADFLANRDAQDIASYRLLVAIEAALALCYHVSSRRLRAAPADYAGCFALLGEAGILEPDLTERLKSMAKFRNLLVHVYWKVDYRRVHSAMQENLGDLRVFAATVVALLDV
ncbi:MAG: DUF86 domain-containing protein [Bryobacterales bacterium]|nr:DUF86 domain-containing protein [Bryobacterales bacterium]